MIVLNESHYENDLRYWLPKQLVFLNREYSIYPDETFAYRKNNVSGKLKNEIYFSGKYYSYYEFENYDEKIEIKDKIKCYEYKEFPFGRVSHFVIFNWLKVGMIGKYTIDYKKKKIVKLSDAGVEKFGTWMQTGKFPETYSSKEASTIKGNDFEEIGKLASNRIKSDGYKYIYEHDANNTYQNLIVL